MNLILFYIEINVIEVEFHFIQPVSKLCLHSVDMYESVCAANSVGLHSNICVFVFYIAFQACCHVRIRILHIYHIFALNSLHRTVLITSVIQPPICQIFVFINSMSCMVHFWLYS